MSLAIRRYELNHDSNKCRVVKQDEKGILLELPLLKSHKLCLYNTEIMRCLPTKILIIGMERGKAIKQECSYQRYGDLEMDEEATIRRMLLAIPKMSDRKIARILSVKPKKVNSIRLRMLETGELHELNHRMLKF